MPKIGNIEITVEGDEALARAFELMSSRMTDWRPLWPDIAAVFYVAEAAWFASEGLGTWPPLSDGYLKWKEKHYPGQKILSRKGALRESLTSRSGAGGVYLEEAQSLEIGTSIPYAKYHQQDDRVGVRLPKRPPVLRELDQAYLNVMARIAVDRFASYAEALGFGTTKD
jgi:phage gpG-like protein